MLAGVHNLPLNGIAEFLVATRVKTPEVTFTEFSKILPWFQFLQAGTHSSERPVLEFRNISWGLKSLDLICKTGSLA
jgi:hypothetical protein